jgi:hypothetical protein
LCAERWRYGAAIMTSRVAAALDALEAEARRCTGEPPTVAALLGKSGWLRASGAVSRVLAPGVGVKVLRADTGEYQIEIRTASGLYHRVGRARGPLSARRFAPLHVDVVAQEVREKRGFIIR